MIKLANLPEGLGPAVAFGQAMTTNITDNKTMKVRKRNPDLKKNPFFILFPPAMNSLNPSLQMSGCSDIRRSSAIRCPPNVS